MAAKFDAIAPSFLVKDVVRAAGYYRDKMGFEISPYFGDPPVFTIVRRGDARASDCASVRLVVPTERS
jgi:hypothetical protein